MKGNAYFLRPPQDDLVPLYRRAFGGSEAEARALFRTLAPDAAAIVRTEGDAIVFEGLAVPMERGGQIGYYLYALCTAPSRRGRGYLRAAIDFIKERAAAEGCTFLLLIPATPELAAAYRRMGFTETCPLTSDEGGRHSALCLPPVGEETPFDGDYARLYAAGPRALPFSCFTAALMSVSDICDIYYTAAGGYRVREKRAPDRCFACDSASLPADVPAAAEALLCPLPGYRAVPGTADPLPR